jgi:N6-adenosine-specific RNA methylase IME4
VRYRTIVADPPWHYDGFGVGIGSGRGTKKPMPYQTMSVDEIKALPVADLADDAAHLYLWTTTKYLRSAFEVAESWGFRYAQILVWVKPTRATMLGGAFGCNVEFALFCRRGVLAHVNKSHTAWWEWSRSQHSRKPEAFLDMVESVSPGPYLELFSRRARFGWDYWGDESLSTVEMPA